MERRSADGYRFSSWDDKAFVASPVPAEEEAKFAISTDYGDSLPKAVNSTDCWRSAPMIEACSCTASSNTTQPRPYSPRH